MGKINARVNCTLFLFIIKYLNEKKKNNPKPILLYAYPNNKVDKDIPNKYIKKSSVFMNCLIFREAII